MGPFPGEVLVRIFHALPWRDRVRGAEAVCKLWRELMRTRGWTDVRHFSDRDRYLYFRRFGSRPTYYTARISQLLDRFGANLRSLAFNLQYPNSPTVLLPLLGKCSQLLHLSLDFYSIEPAIIEHISRAYAPTLKSLRLKICVGDLGEALSQFASLEYLQIAESGSSFYGSISNLCLTPVAFESKLRNVVIRYHARTQKLGIMKTLASFPSLRSLSITGLSNVVDLSFLQRFSRLEHLLIGGLGPDNQRSFVAALPHMAKNLRALEVGDVSQPCSMKHLLEAIATGVPRLEHLGLLRQSGSFIPEVMCNSLEHLRSLQIKFTRFRFENWKCLTGLEYLELESTLPHAIVRELVRSCKNLRCMKFHGYRPNLHKQEDLINVAAGASDGEKEDEESEQSSSTARFPLLIQLEDGWKCDAEITRGSLLKFVERIEPSSYVLRPYKYGHLTEGAPEFAEW